MTLLLDEGYDPFAPERWLVVEPQAVGDSVAEDLRRIFPDWDIACCDSYLAAIADLQRRPTRAVLACVDPAFLELKQALTGLREAAGPNTKLLLCCTPEAEPAARRVLSPEIDDYVLYPLASAELQTALGAESDSSAPSSAGSSAGSFAELPRLVELMGKLEAPPRVLLQEAAELVRQALHARGVTVVADGTAVSAGAARVEPVLHASLIGRERPLGQISVGASETGPYTAQDAQKLTDCAALVSSVLEAATRYRKWHKLAVTDELTGLPNRRYLHQRLAHILAQAAEQRFAVSVLVFDVDDFKRYNDEFGHAAGDEILRLTGALFRAHCRPHDLVTRYGGDEFAVVFWDPDGPRLAGSKPPESALAVLKRFTDALRSHQFPELGPTGKGVLTISGGIATYPWDASDPEGLLRQADHALLAAKRAGKDQILLIGEHEKP